MSKNTKKLLGRLCGGLGTLLILLVMLICLPLTAPRLLGYEVYAIVSGSMEPAIPTGSLIYVKPVDPRQISSGAVATFYGGPAGDSVITHRVVENNAGDQELITKGDANAANDVTPIPYSRVIGQVSLFTPFLGMFLPAISSTGGKLSLAGILAAAVLFCVVGELLQRSVSKQIKAEAMEAMKITSRPIVKKEEPAADTAGEKPAPKKKKRRNDPLQIAIIVLLLVGMVGAGSQMVKTLLGYYRGKSSYDDLSSQVVATAVPMATPTPEPEATEEPWVPDEYAPISVDWDELLAINSEVVGWIYQPDTVINYPVTQTTDNDFYLHADLEGHYDVNGTVFVDMDSMLQVIRSNYILYGHHMANGSMFASLDKYSKQEYFDEHPKMYYLTPEGNYRIELIAAHVVESIAENYPIYFSTLEEYQAFLDAAVEDSTFETIYDVSTNYQLMSLSTCNYSGGYSDPRMLVHGMMIPIG